MNRAATFEHSIGQAIIVPKYEVRYLISWIAAETYIPCITSFENYTSSETDLKYRCRDLSLFIGGTVANLNYYHH
jgi:hypothetical protein